MKPNLTTAAILFTLGITLSTGACAQQTSLELKTQKDKASYAIGASIAKSLQRDGVEVDTAILLRGLNDGLAGGKLLLTDEEAKAAITSLQQESKAKHEAQQKILGDANQKESETFLANNKTQKGVVTLPSGLQYKVEKQGDGPKPLAADTVVCNYRGTLINGKEFDSSYKRGQPATFPVSGVIPGWTEILQLMPVGSKYQVFIPSDLAYKGRGAGADIGPNATLIFEIELLSIQEKPAAAGAGVSHGAAAPAPHTAKPAEPAK